MPDWIAEIDRIDHYLHSIGIPDGIRMKFVAELMTCKAQAAKLAAQAAENERTAKLCKAMGTTPAARELGISPRTARWRRGKALNVGNG